jgi:polysaccharide pyruvyl transferase WcaK-like protein
MAKKLAVLGYYGHGNFGDELMLEGLRRLFKDWEITVMSDNYRSSFPKLNLDVVNECDLFVLGGGELVNSDRLFSSDLYGFLRSSWVKRIRIPKVILGCGVNAENACQLKPSVISDLEQFSFIGLRDNASVNILKKIPRLADKVRLFHDLSFAVEIKGCNGDSKTGWAVVIPTDRKTSKHDSGIQNFNLAGKSQYWLREKLKPYSSVVFLAFGEQDNDDFETCRLLSSCVSGDVLRLRAKELSLEKILGLLSGCAVVFPYRLHGLILSFIAGSKFEVYPYHRKIWRVHDTIRGHSLSEIRGQQMACFAEMLMSCKLKDGVFS